MSQIYSSLPKTKGKVVLVTDCGDVEIELFSKEAPKACKNFVQLCLEDFYNGMIFHRIVADQFVQTGDPTGNGDYGESIYEKGKQFEAEYHSRLKFIQRGLVACAAQNNKSDSRFFITVNKLEALNFKHTIFGQVVGNTIFNVLKIAELEVDQNDRPTYPPKIIRAEVIINPFDDIVPRKKDETATSSTHKRKKQQNKNILSFSDEIDEHEVSSKKQKKELQKLEKELSEVDTLDDDTTTVPVRNTSSSSTQNVTSAAMEESSTSHNIRTDIEVSQQQDNSSVESKFSSLRKEREAKEIESLQNRTKQQAKSYLNEQMQKYKRNKKDKEERERDALQRFEMFSKGLKNSNETGWHSHSLDFKEKK